MAWSNARIRALLRGLRHPHVLRKESAMPALRRRYGTEDDGKALLAAVDAALAGDPALKEIVYRCDLRGEDTRSVANALHFSERQFHRYRSFAIEAVAAEVERALAHDQAPSPGSGLLDAISLFAPDRARALWSEHDGAADGIAALTLRVESGDVPTGDDVAAFTGAERFAAEVLRATALETAGRYDEAEALVAGLRASLAAEPPPERRAAALGLAAQWRLQARRRGRIDAFAEAIDAVVRAAGRDEAMLVRAAIARAHLGVHRAIADWRERLTAAKRAVRGGAPVRTLRYATMVEGYLAYVHGDPDLALRHASIATLAGAIPAIALQSEALHARAALALGRAWTRPDWTRGVLPAVWFQAELDALAAFHALAAGDDAAARALAAQVRAHSAAPYAPSLIAYADAVEAALDGRSPAAVAAPDDLLVVVDLRTVSR